MKVFDFYKLLLLFILLLYLYIILNNFLFKLLFNYPITTSFQVLTNDSVSSTTTTYNDILEKLFTSNIFDDDKLCQVFLNLRLLITIQIPFNYKQLILVPNIH